MSRIGKQTIKIPETVQVLLKDDTVSVKGPRGENSRSFKKIIKISSDGKEVHLEPLRQTIFSNALWGTYASHIQNMIAGVQNEFEKKLLIEGIGFRAEISGKTLVLNIGFSHPVKIPIPNGLSVKVEKSLIAIRGVDKELVGQFAAYIRERKKPEPYKGKGIKIGRASCSERV